MPASNLKPAKGKGRKVHPLSTGWVVSTSTRLLAEGHPLPDPGTRRGGGGRGGEGLSVGGSSEGPRPLHGHEREGLNVGAPFQVRGAGVGGGSSRTLTVDPSTDQLD